MLYYSPMKTLATFAIICVLLTPNLVFAQALQGINAGIKEAQDVANKGGLFEGDTGAINPILARAINFLLSITAVVALLVLIWGALMYILSFGNEKKAATAKNIMVYAVVGLILAALSFAIIQVVKSFLVK